MNYLRIYTLKNKEAADKYFKIHWKRHLESLPKYGITVLKVFHDDNTHIYAVISYNGQDPQTATKEYMNSSEFKNDMSGFDLNNISKVTESPIEFLTLK